MATITPEQQAALAEKYGQKPISQSGETVTVQPQIPLAPVEPSLQEQSNMSNPNYDLTANIVNNSLGLDPNTADRTIITSDEQGGKAAYDAKMQERQQALQLLSPEQQSKVQLATEVGTNMVSKEETKQQIIDRIMQDDSLSLTEKTKAIEAYKNNESKFAKSIDNVASDEIEQKRAQFQKAKAEVEAYNKAVEGTPYQPKPLPTLSDFGLSPAATGETVINATTPTAEEVERDAAPFRQAASNQQAMQKVAAEQAQKVQQAAKEVQNDDDAIQAIDPDRFWNSRSTWQNIALGLALATGGYAAGLTGKENQALNYIMKQIDNDIESQKLTNEQKLAKQKQAMQKVIDEITVKEEQSNIEVDKARMQQMRQEMILKQQELTQKQLLAKHLSGKGPIETSLVTNPEDQKRIVRVKDLAYLADSGPAAEKIRTSQENLIPPIDITNEMIEMSKNANLKTNYKDWALFNQKLNQLAGALRIEITGPGVFTEYDKEFVKEVIGNPAKIFSISSVERAKLEQLNKRLQDKLETNYKLGGVTPQKQPKSAYELFVERAINKGIDKDRAEALAKRTLGVQ